MEGYAPALEWLRTVSEGSKNFFMSSPLEERNRSNMPNVRTGMIEQTKRTVFNVLFNHVQRRIGVYSFVFAKR